RNLGNSPVRVPTAPEVGALYITAQRSCEASIEAILSCGRALIDIKASLPHGEWMLWLKDHQSELGFHDRTAQRLMNAAKKYSNTSLTSDLVDSAGPILKRVWGNEPPERESHALSVTRLEAFAKWALAHDPAAVG